MSSECQQAILIPESSRLWSCGKYVEVSGCMSWHIETSERSIEFELLPLGGIKSTWSPKVDCNISKWRRMSYRLWPTAAWYTFLLSNSRKTKLPRIKNYEEQPQPRRTDRGDKPSGRYEYTCVPQIGTDLGRTRTPQWFKSGLWME